MSPVAQSAIDAARQKDGKFGTQPAEDVSANVDLITVDMAETDSYQLGTFIDFAEEITAASEVLAKRHDLTPAQADHLSVVSYLEEVEEHLVGAGLFEPFAEADDDGGIYVSTPTPHEMVSLRLPNGREEYVTAYTENDNPLDGTPFGHSTPYFTVGELRAVQVEAQRIYDEREAQKLQAELA